MLFVSHVYADGTWHHYEPCPTGKGVDATPQALPDQRDFIGIFLPEPRDFTLFFRADARAARRSVEPKN